MPAHLPPEDLNAYLNGTQNPARRKRVEAWLRASATNREVFFQKLEARERRELWLDSQTENELSRVLSGMQADGSDAEAQSLPVRPLYRRRWWMVAASLAFLLLAAYGFRDQLLYQNTRPGTGQLTRVELNDGSAVELNANSVLRVSRLVRWQPVRRVQTDGRGLLLRRPHRRRPPVRGAVARRHAGRCAGDGILGEQPAAKKPK